MTTYTFEIHRFTSNQTHSTNTKHFVSKVVWAQNWSNSRPNFTRPWWFSYSCSFGVMTSLYPLLGMMTWPCKGCVGYIELSHHSFVLLSTMFPTNNWPTLKRRESGNISRFITPNFWIWLIHHPLKWIHVPSFWDGM